MEPKQAKETIRQALDAAIQKGCYSLADADLIIQALKEVETETE